MISHQLEILSNFVNQWEHSDCECVNSLGFEGPATIHSRSGLEGSSLGKILS